MPSSLVMREAWLQECMEELHWVQPSKVLEHAVVPLIMYTPREAPQDIYIDFNFHKSHGEESWPDSFDYYVMWLCKTVMYYCDCENVWWII